MWSLLLTICYKVNIPDIASVNNLHSFSEKHLYRATLTNAQETAYQLFEP